MMPACRRSTRAALLLDLDGTLLDIAPTPDAVMVPPGLPDVLRTLRRLLGDAVAVVTGRPVETVDALLGDAVFAVAGEHGGAIRHAPGGRLERPPLPSPPGAWLESRRNAWRGSIRARCWNARRVASRCIIARYPSAGPRCASG